MISSGLVLEFLIYFENIESLSEDRQDIIAINMERNILLSNNKRQKSKLKDR